MNFKYGGIIMKRFGLLLIAAVMGSALTIGTFSFIERGEGKTFRIEHIAGTPVVGATYTVNNDGEVVPLEFTEVAKKVMPAVVNIKSTHVQKKNSYQQRGYSDPFEDDIFKYFFGPQQQQRGPQTSVSTGSGVIINADGYIVTNNHVINNADDIEVTLDNNKVYKAKVVGADPSTDIALLQIRESNLPYVPLVNSDEVEVGEWVLAVGNPFNLTSTVTAGIVSAKGRNINILQDRSPIESFIQTDAAINPGNSGGALVNLKGGLVGINTAIASPTGTYTGYGFAVPANIVSKVVYDLQKYGMVQRGYLGLIIRSVNGNLAKEKDLDVTEGVYIDSIAAKSAAGEAGVKKGDVVLKIDDATVKTSADLLEIIGRHHPGDEVQLLIDRKGKTEVYSVVLRNEDGNEKMRERNSKEIFDVLGVELEKIDTKTARSIGIDGGLKVSKLSNGLLKKHTDIKEGFIITRVDGKSFETVEDLAKYLENKKGGVMIEGVYEDYPGSYYYALGL